MTLTSMPPTPGNESSVLSLHHSLISTLSHLFVMKMDWLQARGLLCVGGLKMWTVSSLQKRSAFNCPFTSIIKIINDYAG